MDWMFRKSLRDNSIIQLPTTLIAYEFGGTTEARLNHNGEMQTLFTSH